MFSFTIWDLYIQFNSLVCVHTRVCYRVTVFCSANVHIYISKTFSLCKGMQCQLEMCVLLKLRHSKIPSVSLSLSFLQLHCSLPNILLQPFLGFLWFEVYKTFLWSITQSLCIYNYKLCSGYLLFCQSLSFCWIIYSFDKFVQILLMSFFFFDFILINI